MAKVTLKTATDAQLRRAATQLEEELETTRLGSQRERDLLVKLDKIERELEKREARANPSARELASKAWSAGQKGREFAWKAHVAGAKFAYEHPEFLMLLGPEMAPVAGGIKAIKAVRKNSSRKRKPRTEAQFRAALEEIEPRQGTAFALRTRRKAGAHKDKSKYARRRKHRGSED